MMRNFILGVVVTLVVLILGGLGVALLGFMPTQCERRTSADWSAARHERRGCLHGAPCPARDKPVPPTDENLIDGMKIYTMNCAGCHGGLDNKPSPLANSFYPPPPQLILIRPMIPMAHLLRVRTGIRYTGMPAWDKALSEQDMWKVTVFLSHIEKLPPAVQDYWKNALRRRACRRARRATRA